MSALHDGLIPLLQEAAAGAEAFVRAATAAVRAEVAPEGRIDRAAMQRNQHRVHGLAWFAAYAAVLDEVAGWASPLEAEGRFGEIEARLAAILAADYGAQLMGGVPMSQGEFARPSDFELSGEALGRFYASDWGERLAARATQDDRTRLAALIAERRGAATLETTGLDGTHELIREQFHAFAREKVAPFAQHWHLDDALIPLSLIEELSALGVFGLTVPEAHGGAGLGKLAMCVVSEALSRGWIGVGSLATRAEIAAELILSSGTATQKTLWLPKIASGETIPTAVFTEPDTGSNLGALTTRAVRDGDVYRVAGAKTWITHAARADLMTLLVRTDPASKDYRGLSMLLAEKPRGTEAEPFPAAGMAGGEVKVIGYRGMREYDLAFDGFAVPADNLLGGVEGEGFRQLMATFESARIQTAARAIGVAEAALHAGLGYALERRQFGQPIFDFPRVHNKLAAAAAEIMGVRQLTYRAARAKDAGRRCDLEAGMAKLLAARAAWSAADAAVQIHGGVGYATESVASRLLADARVLSIFEGAAEIQAEVIASRLLEQGRNG